MRFMSVELAATVKDRLPMIACTVPLPNILLKLSLMIEKRIGWVG